MLDRAHIGANSSGHCPSHAGAERMKLAAGQDAYWGLSRGTPAVQGLYEPQVNGARGARALGGARAERGRWGREKSEVCPGRAGRRPRPPSHNAAIFAIDQVRGAKLQRARTHARIPEPAGVKRCPGDKEALVRACMPAWRLLPRMLACTLRAHPHHAPTGPSSRSYLWSQNA